MKDEKKRKKGKKQLESEDERMTERKGRKMKKLSMEIKRKTRKNDLQGNGRLIKKTREDEGRKLSPPSPSPP